MADNPHELSALYALDVLDFRLGRVEDGVMQFSRAGGAAAARATLPAPAGEVQPALSG